MPEVDPNAPTNEEPKKLAGKFDTPADLEKGYRELSRKLGSDLGDAPLVGEGGLFVNHEALEKVYKHSESVLGRMSTSPKPDNPPDPSDLRINKGDNEFLDVPDVLQRAGLQAKDLEEQWEKNGKLTEDQYAAFRKVNPALSRAVVNHIAEGMAAKAVFRQQQTAEAIREAQEIVGGEAELATLREWAATNIPKDRLARLNAQLDADVRFYGDYIRLIHAEYAKATGSSGTSPILNGTTAPTGKLPTNLAEFGALMRRVNRSDADALATLAKIPQETIERYQET